MTGELNHGREEIHVACLMAAARLCCALLLCASASGLHVLYAPTTSRSCVSMMAKGRSQGGGPKAVNNNRKRKSEKDVSVGKKVRALSREGRKRKPPTTLFPKRQMERFVNFLDQGSASVAVCMRVPGSEWLEVGHVSFDEGTDALVATQLQKRLVIEHAMRLHGALLQPHRDELECGVRVPPADGGGAAPGEEEPVHEAVLLEGVEAAAAPGIGGGGGASCGFLGMPIPGVGHYWSGSDEGSTGDAESRKVTLEKLGVDSKSAVATAFQKQLGLRSG